jgi:hypothetical protein
MYLRLESAKQDGKAKTYFFHVFKDQWISRKFPNFRDLIGISFEILGMNIL